MSRVVSVRLSKDLEEKLNLAMKLKRVNKVSEILIEALNIGLDEIIKRERIMEELAREMEEMLRRGERLKARTQIDVEKIVREGRS